MSIEDRHLKLTELICPPSIEVGYNFDCSQNQIIFFFTKFESNILIHSHVWKKDIKILTLHFTNESEMTIFLTNCSFFFHKQTISKRAILSLWSFFTTNLQVGSNPTNLGENGSEGKPNPLPLPLPLNHLHFQRWLCSSSATPNSAFSMESEIIFSSPAGFVSPIFLPLSLCFSPDFVWCMDFWRSLVYPCLVLY